MTIGGIVEIIMTIPAGPLIDPTTCKRTYVIIPSICTALASTLIIISQAFWLISLSQQAYTHAGNVGGTALSGFLGWKFGMTAVFWLASLLGVLSIISVLPWVQLLYRGDFRLFSGHLAQVIL